MLNLSKHKTMETFLSVAHKALWNFIPFIFKLRCKKTMCGYSISYRPFLATDRNLLSEGFEKGVKAVFTPQPNDVFVDIGANIGLYTLFTCKKIGDSGKVIAVEPDDSNLIVLKESIKTNRFNNVMVVPCAVGANNCKQIFYEGIMPTASSFYPDKQRTTYKVRSKKTVNVVTLDSVIKCSGVTRVDWIKIDAEGAELDILAGAKETIDKFRPVILVEAINSFNAVAAFFTSMSYSINNIATNYYCAKPN